MVPSGENNKPYTDGIGVEVGEGVAVSAEIVAGAHATKSKTTNKTSILELVFILPIFCTELSNGLRYPLVGGTRQRRFDGINLKPHNPA